MKVTVWRAWASNNSGSYTLVGLLPSVEVAAELAAEIAELCRRQSSWYEAGGDRPGTSPLAELARAQGLNWHPDFDDHDHWPHYGVHPQVGAFGPQLVVHVSGTISMPPSFGELVFRRG